MKKYKAEEKGRGEKQNSMGNTSPGTPKKDNSTDTALHREEEYTARKMRDEEAAQNKK